MASIVLDAADPRALATFYERLLGWPIVASYGPRPGHPESDGWVMLRPTDQSGRLTGLAIQFEPNYVRPVWPSEPGQPGMMLHLDIAVEDLAAATAFAVEAGATLVEHQPQERVRVLLDPAGHPFCLFLGTV